jgi:hypothetical protein
MDPGGIHVNSVAPGYTGTEAVVALVGVCAAWGHDCALLSERLIGDWKKASESPEEVF